jgi:hypothetical protein
VTSSPLTLEFSYFKRKRRGFHRCSVDVSEVRDEWKHVWLVSERILGASSVTEGGSHDVLLRQILVAAKTWET